MQATGLDHKRILLAYITWVSTQAGTDFMPNQMEPLLALMSRDEAIELNRLAWLLTDGPVS